MNPGLLALALIIVFGLIWIKNSLYVIKEWERGVVLRLGRKFRLLANRNAP